MTLSEKIKQSLVAAGLFEVPTDPQAALVDFGLDSLMVVMLVLDLQRKFNLQVPADLVTGDNMRSQASIEKMLRELGAQ